MLATQKGPDQKHPCLTNGATVVEGFVRAIGRRGIRPGQTAPGPMDDAAQHLSVIDPLYTPFLGEQGAEAGNFSPDKDLKHFCRYGLEQELGRFFAELPGANRFVALIRFPMGSHQGGALLPAEALW